MIKAKIGRLFTPQSTSELYFQSILKQNRFLKELNLQDFVVDNRQISLKSVKRNVMKGLDSTTFFKSLHQNNQFLLNGRL